MAEMSTPLADKLKLACRIIFPGLALLIAGGSTLRWMNGEIGQAAWALNILVTVVIAWAVYAFAVFMTDELLDQDD